MTLNELIREACDKHTAIPQATKCAIGLLEANPAVKAEALLQIVRKGVREFIFEAQYDARNAAKKCSRGIEAIAAAGKVLRRSLLDDWILRGVRLGDYRGTDLPEFAEQSRLEASGHEANARFFEWLAGKAGRKMIRNAVTPEEAARKWNDIATTLGVEAE